MKPAIIALGKGKYCSAACCGRGKTLEERLWEKINICSHGTDCPYCCHQWTGATNNKNYGMISYKTEKGWTHGLVHRLTWSLYNKRPIPPLMGICHHCDVTLCCNGFHLHCGDQKRNMRDAFERHKLARGEKQTTSLLREKDIPLIFQMHHNGLTQVEIGSLFGVRRGTISEVLRYKNWKHISLNLTEIMF